MSYMEPVIKPGQIVRVRMLSHSESLDLRRFDIVVVRNLPHLPHLKGDYPLRVIGLPGEIIHFTDKGVFINDDQIKYPTWLGYLKDRLKEAEVTGSRSIDIPEDQCFLIGDNLEIAIDSRYFGAVSIDKIVGIVDGKL